MTHATTGCRVLRVYVLRGLGSNGGGCLAPPPRPSDTPAARRRDGIEWSGGAAEHFDCGAVKASRKVSPRRASWSASNFNRRLIGRRLEPRQQPPSPEIEHRPL